MTWPVACFLLLLCTVLAWEAVPDAWRDGVLASPAGPVVRAAFAVAVLLVYGGLLPR